MELKLNYPDPVPNEKVNLTSGPTRENHWSKKRQTRVPSNLVDYDGENLVFVVGPPRSGTTWVLKLLSEHPDVVAATADNLGLPSRGESTETGVFATDIPDTYIAEKFLQLSFKNKGKVIVEKTPVHLFYVDRILRIFPKAAIVMTRRGGRDTVASILAVGRKKDSWWRDAPWKADAACRMWVEYAVASSRCEGMYNPYVVRYEDLHADPAGGLRSMLGVLGMRDDYVDRCVDASRGGRNIKIEGVFRKGQVGGWREVLTAEDVLAFEDIAHQYDWQPMNNGSKPAVTVILSSFNRPNGLKRSFRSLLEQTMSSEQMEVIVCDDGSSKKEMPDLLLRMQNNFNVSVIRGKPSPVEHKLRFCTFTQLINRALAQARGRYITYMTDGDVYAPDRCRKLAAVLDGMRHVDLVWCRTKISEANRISGPNQYRALLSGEFAAMLPAGNFVDHNSIMHRRSHVRWSTSPDSWRFADWLFLQRAVLDGATVFGMEYVGQTLYLTDDSLGVAVGRHGRTLADVLSKRTS